jgi:HEAT repeat protein
MAQSEYVKERRKAVDELYYNFAVLPDWEQAWNDLISLTQDKDDFVRWRAAESLGLAFSHIPEKHREQAWDDLHRDRKSTRLNSSHNSESRMPSSA